MHIKKKKKSEARLVDQIHPLRLNASCDMIRNLYRTYISLKKKKRGIIPKNKIEIEIGSINIRS